MNLLRPRLAPECQPLRKVYTIPKVKSESWYYNKCYMFSLAGTPAISLKTDACCSLGMAWGAQTHGARVGKGDIRNPTVLRQAAEPLTHSPMLCTDFHQKWLVIDWAEKNRRISIDPLEEWCGTDYLTDLDRACSHLVTAHIPLRLRYRLNNVLWSAAGETKTNQVREDDNGCEGLLGGRLN